MNVIKILPPLVLDESDVDWFVEALESVLERARGIPREMVGFALRAARAR
jgi:acetylornithine/succinyldiaminopimelate/putrescine aminotransferase